MTRSLALWQAIGIAGVAQWQSRSFPSIQEVQKSANGDVKPALLRINYINDLSDESKTAARGRSWSVDITTISREVIVLIYTRDMNTQLLRHGWVDFLFSQNYSHAITLKPNNKKFDAGEHFLRRNLDRFHRNLDRRLLGTRFADEKNGVRRTRMVAIMEGLPYNGHIHAAVRVAPELHGRFEALFAAGNPRNPWMAMIPGGTTCIEPITEAEGWHEYATKRFASRDHSDHIIFLPRSN